MFNTIEVSFRSSDPPLYDELGAAKMVKGWVVVDKLMEIFNV